MVALAPPQPSRGMFACTGASGGRGVLQACVHRPFVAGQHATGEAKSTGRARCTSGTRATSRITSAGSWCVRPDSTPTLAVRFGRACAAQVCSHSALLRRRGCVSWAASSPAHISECRLTACSAQHHDALRGLVTGHFYDPRLIQGDAQRPSRYCIKRLREVCDPCDRIAVHASASGNLTGKRRRLGRLLGDWERDCKSRRSEAASAPPRLPECRR